MIERLIEGKLVSLAEKFPVVTLTGPRQSGKTTLVKKVFPDYEYVSLEDPNTRVWAMDDPVAFLDRYPSRTIFDEAQRFPELFSYAQRRIDECGEPGQYIITGSQNFQLIDTVSQSLAGRVAVLILLPLSYAEVMGAGIAAMPSDEWIVRGAYPRIYAQEIEPTDYYPSYVQTYLERDVRKELGVVKIAEFERFLVLCALRTGEILNIAGLARDCGVSTKTAADWLSVLESSYIIHMVQPWYSNAGKRLIKTPKLYFWDTGLACNLIGIESAAELVGHQKRGALFETAVISEVAKHCLARGRKPRLSFWRDTNGAEIDLIVEKGVRPVCAFEIKSSRTFNPKYFDILERIAPGELGMAKGEYAVVYGGNETLETSRGRVLSLNDIPQDLGNAGL